ncbi:hypothetical protein H0H93_014182 [Arthromyces matolae]|nr:hypothetical protein H0H93_014182 [Arthromyces matolae]
MSPPAKLTKKQKKGIAFRERKSGKHPKDGEPNLEDNAVPIMEDQDAVAREADSVEMEKIVAGKKSESATKASGEDNLVKSKTKTDAENTAVDVVPPKKRKLQDSFPNSSESAEGRRSAKRKKPVEGAEDGAEDTKVVSSSKSKQRFILFVDPPPTIRLLTPQNTTGKPTKKSRGCAFLEFTHRNALQQALKLHQSELDGRMINVELTAGGGGKSEKRLEKVRERNKQLHDERKERVEKLAASDNTVIPTPPDKPQRYSATSGLTQTHAKRRTWTVDEVDDGETHRGGQKHKNHSKSKPNGKAWGTGVNAIPVG